jgi:hypothetical protein
MTVGRGGEVRLVRGDGRGFFGFIVIFVTTCDGDAVAVSDSVRLADRVGRGAVAKPTSSPIAAQLVEDRRCLLDHAPSLGEASAHHGDHFGAVRPCRPRDRVGLVAQAVAGLVEPVCRYRGRRQADRGRSGPDSRCRCDSCDHPQAAVRRCPWCACRCLRKRAPRSLPTGVIQRSSERVARAPPTVLRQGYSQGLSRRDRGRRSLRRAALWLCRSHARRP